MLPAAEINYAVEGTMDAAIARRLIIHCGGVPGLERVMGGKSKLDPNIVRYAQSARSLPWLIIRDLDHDADCGPTLRFEKLTHTYEYLCFRIAVRQIESWILFDEEALVAFLRVKHRRQQVDPETLENPKTAILNLGRRSSSLSVRRAIVPREGIGASEGPEYSAFMVEFVERHWRPEVAIAFNPDSSLARAARCLADLTQRARVVA
jgi:hypothetical protein